MPTLHADITSVASASIAASYADVNALSKSITLNGGASSLVLCIAHVNIVFDATDRTADFRFALDGTREGPEMTLCYSDNVDKGTGGMIVWVMNGWTGAKTVSLQGQVRKASPSLDTSRTRSLQVIELESSEANLLVNSTSTASYTFTGSYANITGMSGSGTAQSTSSQILMIANLTIADSTSDQSVDCMFADDGTTEGAVMTPSWTDSTDEMAGAAVMWCKAAADTSSHTYSLQGKIRLSSPVCDTSYTRSFQVLELLNADLPVSTTSTASQSAPTSYADMTGMSGSATPDSSSSIMLMIVNPNIEGPGGDQAADGRFADGGTREGPEVTFGYRDTNDETSWTGMAWAKTGITGSHTFSFQWQDRLVTSGGPETDTGRARSFQVLDIKGGTNPTISSIDGGTETVDTRTSVVLAGTDFEASQGTGKVEVSNNATYGSGIVIEIEVNTWSATSLNVDMHEITTTNPLEDDFTLPGTLYLWVTNNSGDRNGTGFSFTLKPPGATWLAALNTDVTINVAAGNVTKRLRIQIDNDGGNATTPSQKYRYSKNSGAYADITASSSNIRTKGSTHFADGDDCDEALVGAASLITNNNAAEETTGTYTMGTDFTAGSDIETELCFELVSADLADGDTIDIRVYESDNTAFGTYTQTPRITIEKGSTFNETVTLTAANTVTTAGQLTIDAVLSLVGDGSVALSNIMTINVLASLAASNTMTPTNTIVMDVLASLAADGAITMTGGLSLDSVLTLAADGSIDNARTLSIDTVVSLIVDGSVTLSRDVAIDVLTTLTADSGVANSSIASLNALLTLSGASADLCSAVLDVEGALTLTADAVATWSRTKEFTEAVTLLADGEAGPIEDVLLQLSSSLGAVAGLVSTNNAVLGAALALSGNAAVTNVGQLVTDLQASLTAAASLATSRGLSLQESITLAAQVSVNNQTQMVVQGLLSLGVEASQAQQVGVSINAVLTLTAQAIVDALGFHVDVSIGFHGIITNQNVNAPRLTLEGVTVPTVPSTITAPTVPSIITAPTIPSTITAPRASNQVIDY